MIRLALALTTALVVGSCTTTPSEAPSLFLPTVNFNGTCLGIGGAGDDATITGDPSDPRLAWEISPEGTRQDLVWPRDYRARFNPKLEILDASGRVVLREGDRLPDGGCVEGGPDDPGSVIYLFPMPTAH
jgi:hypothetical protein